VFTLWESMNFCILKLELNVQQIRNQTSIPRVVDELTNIAFKLVIKTEIDC